jgi:hypothetical protein
VPPGTIEPTRKVLTVLESNYRLPFLHEHSTLLIMSSSTMGQKIERPHVPHLHTHPANANASRNQLTGKLLQGGSVSGYIQKYSLQEIFVYAIET